MVRGQQVFYANALRDADVFATPLPAGSETFVQLRSYSSPRSIALDLDLPDGARLVADGTPDGGATIVRGTEVLATIAPPASRDANGMAVPTTLRVDANRVTLDVEVTRAAALPVVVDPIVTDNQFAGGNAASIDASFGTARGWRRQTSGALSNFTFTPNGDDNTAGGTCARTRGGSLVTLAGQLCVGTQSATTYSSGGEVGEWAFRPPSGLRSYSTDGANVPTDAYIYRADVRMNYAKLSNPATALMYAGLRSGREPSTYIGSSSNINPDGSANDLRNGLFTAGNAYGVNYNDSFYRIFCVRSDCGGDLNADNSKDGTFFTVGAWATGSGNALVANAQGAIFYENDRTNPVVSGHSTSTDLSGWKRTGTVTTLVSGHDPGMGVKTVGETYTNRNGVLAIVPYSSGCTGASASPCNADLAQTLNTNIDDLPEGQAQLLGYTTDILGKNATGSALTVKVDRSSPTIALSGELAGPDGVIKGDHAYSLHVDATDGVLGGTVAQQRSGVASIDVKVNGVSQGQVTAQTDSRDSAPLSRDYSFPAQTLDEGEYTVDIVAQDRAGNPATTESFKVLVDRSDQPARTTDSSITDDSDADNAADYPGQDLLDLCIPDLNLLTDCTMPESDAATTRSVTDTPSTATAATTAPTIGYYNRPQGVTCPSGDVSKWGISDQKSGVWGIPRLNSLQPTRARARLVVGWDVVQRGEAATSSSDQAYQQLAETDSWMSNVLKHCYEPLIAFEHSHITGRGALKPEAYVEYRAAIEAFRMRYPFVHVFTAWNEPNHPDQPTLNDPATAAHYWRVARNVCAQTGNCSVLAGDMIDRGFQNSGGQTFPAYFSAYKQAMGRRAATWAIHLYQTGKTAATALEANPNAIVKDARWNDFLDSTKCAGCTSYPTPNIWITEHGGTVVINAAHPTEDQAIDFARLQIDHVLGIVNSTSRVKAYLYYSWAGDSNFDSGLVRRTGGVSGSEALKKLATRAKLYCPVFRSFRPGAASPLCA